MHRVLTSLLIAVSLSMSVEAIASDSPKPAAPGGATTAAPKVLDHADELFEQSATAYDAGRFAEALAKLEQAWGLKRTHDIAGNLGVVELKLGKYPEAATHLAWALQHFPPTESDQARQGFQKEADKARAQSGTLRIHVSVAGADVSVNGRSVGTSPLTEDVYIAPGSANVVARRDGYTMVEQAVTVPKGEARDVSLQLLPSGAAPEVRSRVPLVVGGAAISVAAIATGAALLAVAGGKGSDADQMVTQFKSASAPLCPTPSTTDVCGDLFSLRREHDIFHNAGVALLVGGSAVAVGTLAYALWPRGKGATTDALLVPVVSTSGAGVWLHGTF